MTQSNSLVSYSPLLAILDQNRYDARQNFIMKCSLALPWADRRVFGASFYLSSISMQCLVLECSKAVHQSVICNWVKAFTIES